MTVVRKVLSLGIVAALAACGDNAMAPRGGPNHKWATPAQGPTRYLSQTDTLTYTFVIDPNVSATYDLGMGNTLYIPAHTLCDPANSTYGPGEWDNPCPFATEPITVTFRGWLNRYGHPHVDFEPSMRFATPANGGTDWVALSFGDVGAWSDQYSRIVYCATLTQCVDESKTDLDVVTVRDSSTTVIWRRIKHFSGYNVATGDSCTPDPSDPDCIDMGDGH